MTQHDTPDEVEAVAAQCGNMPNPEEAAAMLHRLHTRAVEAERERDGLKTALAAMMGEAQKAQAALVMARAVTLQVGEAP